MPWRRRERDPSEPSEATEAKRRAEKALIADLERLAATRAKTKHHTDLRDALRELHERNHFREAFEASLRGGPS